MTQRLIGGSFAPPLTDELLSKYDEMLSGIDPKSQIADAFKTLLNCCHQWWAQPESTGNGRPHPAGVGFIIDLDKPVADALWEHIPWEAELDAMGQLFEGIDPVSQRDLRNAAFHLLWHAKELVRDREPMTKDKL